MKLYEWIVLSILFAKSRPFPYFQFDDMFHVECIPTVHLKDYVYYGNVSTYINGSLLMTSIPISVTKSSSSSSLLGQCEIWKHVMSSMTRWAVNNNVTNYWTYPDEFVHGAMRTITSIRYIMWHAAFLNVLEMIIRTPQNFHKPSNIILSAEFEKNRYSIFFAMIAVGMTVMICSISFVIARNYIKIKGKRMKQEQMEGNPFEILRLTPKKSAIQADPSISIQALKLKQEMGTLV
ncbi:ABC transporter C family member [Dirofilaria immitis]